MAGELELARIAAEAALSTGGVHSLGEGQYAEAATYGPNEKVTGVVVTDDEVEVHVVALYPPAGTIHGLGESVRENVAPKVEGRRVTVVVEDIKEPEGEGL